MSSVFRDIEPARRAYLCSYDILDTPAEREFDDLAKLAGLVSGAPIALIVLADSDHSWIKARFGLDETATLQSVCLPVDVILKPALTVISDTLLEDPFHHWRFLESDSQVRFYACAPLTTSCGDTLGALCVIDCCPRGLSDDQRAGLQMLAGLVVALIESHRTIRSQSNALSRQQGMEQDLHDSHARFQEFMDHSPMLAFMKDHENRYVYVNRQFEQAFNTSLADIWGATDFNFFPQELAEEYRANDDLVRSSGAALSTLETGHAPEGDVRTWAVTKFRFIDPNGNQCVGGVAADVTEAKRLEQELADVHQYLEDVNRTLIEQQAALLAGHEQLADLAATDGLTELKNHRAFQERLSDEVRRARRYNRPLSIMLLDVDHFKQFNDTFGHPAGDGVLKEVATILKQTVREADLVARYGGEEFVIVMPETPTEGAQVIAERVRQAIERGPWDLRQITVSIGVATLGVASDASSTTAAADKALYASKAAGRNRVSLAVNVPEEAVDLPVA